jgi:uncharacterized protein YndB with AHSA1/START domain
MNAAEIVNAPVRIAASPEEVFPYLVDPSLIVQWIGSWADLNPQPGGVFALDFVGTSTRGTYVSGAPYRWGIPGNAALPPGTSTVEILLRADGDETIVELTHRDLPSELRPSHREGWEECLEVLRKTFKS